MWIVDAGEPVGERLVDQFASGSGSSEGDNPATLVVGATTAGDKSGSLQAVDSLRNRSRGDHGVRGELAGCPCTGLAARRRGTTVEFPLAETVAAVDETQLLGEPVGQTVQPSDHSLQGDADGGPFAAPVGPDASYGPVIAGLPWKPIRAGSH